MMWAPSAPSLAVLGDTHPGFGRLAGHGGRPMKLIWSLTLNGAVSRCH
jgi:hypothetical protein